MKKSICLILSCMLLCCGTALAEQENQGGWLDQLGGIVTDALNQAGTFFTNASQWVSQNWGEAAQWVEKAWGQSSEWVQRIWGDASKWAQENLNGASAWWTETYARITATADDAWKWMRDTYDQLLSQAKTETEGLKQAVASQAEDTVKQQTLALLKEMKLSDEDAAKVWETLEAYAEQKGISTLSAAKLALPSLLQLTVDSRDAEPMPAVAVAQYLTAVIEKMGVTNEAEAQELIDQLNTALNR